jgi:hypothetical protein
MLSESYSKTQNEKTETADVTENNEFDATGVESGEEDNNVLLPDVTANNAPAIPVFSGIPKMPVFTPPMPVFNAQKVAGMTISEKDKIEYQPQNEETIPITENTENDTKQKKVNLLILYYFYYFYIFVFIEC